MNVPRWQLVPTSILFFAASALSVACQETKSPIAQANREIGVSFAPSLIAYREYADDGTELDSEHGWISGVGVEAAIPFSAFKLTHLLAEVDYEFDDGSSKHWSQSLTGSGTLQYQAPFTSNDVRLGIGKTFVPATRFSFTPEAEAEYREWHRDLPKAGLSIEENYTFWSPGGAVHANYNPVGQFVVKARVGVAHTVFPTNAGIGNPANQVPNITFSLGTRYVWQADLGIDYAICRSLHAIAGIDYSHFGFGRSGNVSYAIGKGEYEPNSVTDLAKINVGLAWAF